MIKASHILDQSIYKYNLESPESSYSNDSQDDDYECPPHIDDSQYFDIDITLPFSPKDTPLHSQAQNMVILKMDLIWSCLFVADISHIQINALLNLIWIVNINIQIWTVGFIQ